ncbi:NEW3 domain-containing protein [Jiella sp. MQZ9-1]|uniref:Alpha-galactosidase NEW3 domain-containing protein n=1 Tax=Jiella flava TaxID=2816857 RepID=A0A939G3P9_9HYPH|nr:NEW3 domain-containing protein [Jiella flava]MBO0664499.1 hypothetical protein [Jiella flava]MCD2473135.1 NEW3 domain-containing protein [Jiella flava]
MIRVPSLPSAILFAGGLVLCASPVLAQDQTNSTKPTGLWLTTDFPAVTERIGEKPTLPLTLTNAGEPPQRVTISLDGLPKGWSGEVTGDGKPIGAAMVDTDAKQRLELKLTEPKGAKPGTYDFTINAHPAGGAALTLPVSITLAAAAPDKVKIEPKLPALRGTPRSSFDYSLSISNDSPNEATYNLLAQTPPGFVATFKEEYGSQELTSMPIKAGETKTVKLSVKPPKDVKAGLYPVTVAASNGDVHGQARLAMDITGQPNVTLSGPGGRLSGSAEAGKEQTFNFTVGNTGTAPAAAVTLSANTPSGWKASFEPKTLDGLSPDDEKQVVLHLTPSDKAIAGDYMVSLDANGQGTSDSEQFRVTVTTSTLWGAGGLAIIAAAVVVLGFSVNRYGRR